MQAHRSCIALQRAHLGAAIDISMSRKAITASTFMSRPFALSRSATHQTQAMSAAVDSEHCGGQHSMHRRSCSPGVPFDCGSDAVAQSDYGLPCLFGPGHRAAHRLHVGPATLLLPPVPSHPYCGSLLLPFTASPHACIDQPCMCTARHCVKRSAFCCAPCCTVFAVSIF